MTRPNVIFATTVFDEAATGPGRYARYLWDALRDDDEIEFHVVAPRVAERHPRLHAAEEGGGSVYRRVSRGALALADGRQRDTIIHGNAAHAMGDVVGYRGPWIAQVNDYEVATFWSHFVSTLLHRGPRRVASLAWRRRQERRVLPAATRVVCNSNFTRDAVLAAYGLDGSNVVTIHKAVSTTAFARPEDGPVAARLAFVGSNWRIKGLDVLLRAVARLAESHGEVTLAVAGHDPSRVGRRMRRLAERLGLAGRVSFLGRLDQADLARLLWHSDVLVLPSRQEAFGVAALEAMAAGVAVVASDVGGLGEIVRDRCDGLLCPPGRPAPLADAIGEILTDDALHASLARGGRERAAEFDVDAMVRRVRELYLSLLRSR